MALHPHAALLQPGNASYYLVWAAREAAWLAGAAGRGAFTAAFLDAAALRFLAHVPFAEAVLARAPDAAADALSGGAFMPPQWRGDAADGNGGDDASPLSSSLPALRALALRDCCSADKMVSSLTARSI
jgi:hypothetical protein